MLQEKIFVRSQLIPLHNMWLVLPNTSVAEIINYQAAVKVQDPPDWLMGVFNWRGVNIPLLKFETMACGDIVNPGKRSRIIVLNAATEVKKRPFYALLSQGIPRLMSLSDDSIFDSSSQKIWSYVLRNTVIEGIETLIPDQKAIEAELDKINLAVDNQQ